MSASGRVPYEYAVLRVVPRPELGERLNAGVVLYCPERRFLGAGISLDEKRSESLWPELDTATVLSHLRGIATVCEGGVGPLGGLPQRQRFGRAIAPRSGVIQPSEVHTGLTRDPASTLERLVALITDESNDNAQRT